MDPAETAAALIDAFNRADWDAFEALLAPDTAYIEAGTGRRGDGPEAYLALVRGWKAAMPDVAGTVRATVAGEDLVVQDVLWEGTHTGPMETPAGVLPASGARVSVEGSLWARVEGDKVREVRHHLDVLTLLQQVGALPAG